MTVSPLPAGGIVSDPSIVRVFLSGPMTGDNEFDYPTFLAVADLLRAAGHEVFNPADNGLDTSDLDGLTVPETFDNRTAFADYAVWITTVADAVAVLPGWEKSTRARAGVALALAIGLPILDALTGRRVIVTLAGTVLDERAPTDLGTVRAGIAAREEDALDASIARHPGGKVALRDGTPLLSIEETPKRPDLRVAGASAAPTMIALNGCAQVGKDAFADILVKEYGYQIVSPSNVLREFLYKQDLYLPSGERLCTVVDEHGWEKARALHPYIRDLQQNSGTEAGRKVLHEDVWNDAMMARLADGARHVSTRVMYPNDARAIASRGGIIVRVTRPGVTAANGHDSDTALDDWPFEAVIDNDGTLDDLRAKVVDLMDRLGAEPLAA